jgi:hypothetical protein
VATPEHEKPRSEHDRKGIQDRLYDPFAYSQIPLLRAATGHWKWQARRLAVEPCMWGVVLWAGCLDTIWSQTPGTAIKRGYKNL